MQKFVHWVAATDEDRAFGSNRTAKALARIAQVQGQAFGVALDLIPFDVPRPLTDPESATAPLYFLRPSDFGDAQAFGDAHLRAAIADRGMSAADFLATYRPIAMLGVTSSEALARTGSITCLMDRDGEMFVVRGPGSAGLLWVGYLDEILASIMK